MQYNRYGPVKLNWSPWKSLPLMIAAGAGTGLVVIGVALGL
ncbi:unnamed protein product, partial [Adineta steineri]